MSSSAAKPPATSSWWLILSTAGDPDATDRAVSSDTSAMTVRPAVRRSSARRPKNPTGTTSAGATSAGSAPVSTHTSDSSALTSTVPYRSSPPSDP